MARARNLLRRRMIRRGLVARRGSGRGARTASASAAAWRLARPPRIGSFDGRGSVRVAAGQATAQLVSGFAASLVQSMHWSMTMIKIKMAIVGVIVVVLVGSGGWFASLRPLAQCSPKIGRKLESPVEKSKSTKSQKLYSLVEGQTTIMELVPDGSTVKKGQVVCSLDSAMLRDQLTNQQIQHTYLNQ